MVTFIQNIEELKNMKKEKSAKVGNIEDVYQRKKELGIKYKSKGKLKR
ncbi:hypothetical protein ACHLQO_12235 [Staphylococcus aureus]